MLSKVSEQSYSPSLIAVGIENWAYIYGSKDIVVKNTHKDNTVITLTEELTIRSLCYTPSGDSLVSVCGGRTKLHVQIHSTSSWDILRTYISSTFGGKISCVKINHISTGLEMFWPGSKGICFWNLETGHERICFEGVSYINDNFEIQSRKKPYLNKKQKILSILFHAGH